MPRTGLEPARLSTLAPETSASTIPPPGLELKSCGCLCYPEFFDCKVNAFYCVLQILRVFLFFCRIRCVTQLTSLISISCSRLLGRPVSFPFSTGRFCRFNRGRCCVCIHSMVARSLSSGEDGAFGGHGSMPVSLSVISLWPRSPVALRRHSRSLRRFCRAVRL